MERTLERDPAVSNPPPVEAPAESMDEPAQATSAEPVPDAEPDRGWLLTAVLVALIVMLALCAALALIAWNRAPVGAAG